MLVRMLVDNSGEWPPIGGTIELRDDIALELIERGEAVDPNAEPAPKVETASVDGATETAVKRGPGRPRKAAK